MNGRTPLLCGVSSRLVASMRIRQILERRDVGWLLVLVAFFLLTSRWLDYPSGVTAAGGLDTYQYERMSAAAPGLPDSLIGSAYTSRFALHWSIGALSATSGMSLASTYRVVCLIVMISLGAVLVRVLRRLGVQSWALVSCVALMMLNPYAMRYYTLAPAYVADLVFQLGLGLAFLGLLARRPGPIVLGVVLGTVSRQTMLVAAPLLALWYLLESQHDRRSTRGLTAVTIAGLPVVVFLLVTRVAEPFTTPFAPQIPKDTIVPLLAVLPASGVELGQHVLRVLAPLMLTLLVLAGLLFVCLRQRIRPPRSFYLALLLWAAISGQPLVIGPGFAGFTGNEPRLSALGLLALVFAVGILFRTTGLQLHAWQGVTLMVLVLIASLHPRYTVLGPASTPQFLVLQALISLAASLLVVLPPSLLVRPVTTSRERSTFA